MATALIPTGSEPATSATFTLTATDAATVFLEGADSMAGVAIDIQNVNTSNYTQVATLTAASPSGVIKAAGTYRARRFAGTCGVARG